MKQVLYTVLFFLISILVVAQTKVGGKVVDEFGDPIAFANVVFKNSKEGVITNENGIFYFESSVLFFDYIHLYFFLKYHIQ